MIAGIPNKSPAIMSNHLPSNQTKRTAVPESAVALDDCGAQLALSLEEWRLGEPPGGSPPSLFSLV